jgi:hypothetical protein
MTGETPSLTLYPKKSTAIWLLLCFSLFVAIGIVLGMSEGWAGYLCAALFAIGIPVAVIQLLPGSTYLHVDESGFTFCNFFRRTTVPWSVVDEFFVVTLKQSGIRVHSMVGFNYVASYDRAFLGRRIARVVGKCEGALPDTYGKKAEELADFLNACLERARTNGREPSPKSCR